MNPQDRSPQKQGIRNAAVLVASLDRASADAVLEQLDPDQAGRVRQAMVELGEIDTKEQRRVIDEFFRRGPMVPKKQPPGIELDDRLARKLSMTPTYSPPRTRLSSLAADPRPFGFLRRAEAEKLARVLGKERPQTIALVLSHLPPHQAASVLARLPGALQADVIRRLVDLEETDPEILREVERALESRLSQQIRMQRRRVAGMEAVAGILEACEGQIGTQILNNLAARDPLLAEQLSPRPMEFEDLAQLDDGALKAVLQAAEAELAMTALVGAPPELVDRILRRFPPSEAEIVRHKLDHPGPIRLRDVESARRQIAELARRLAIEGRIQLPDAKPVTVS